MVEEMTSAFLLLVFDSLSMVGIKFQKLNTVTRVSSFDNLQAIEAYFSHLVSYPKHFVTHTLVGTELHLNTSP